ncbi:unnamed protein product [Calicophoron daubneyi]|uniref:Uncharacterized protein n=1 Tax=Calicophoron daubneyi TaxID=300641 RepID=A0AAV2SYL2_CALDB
MAPNRQSNTDVYSNWSRKSTFPHSVKSAASSRGSSFYSNPYAKREQIQYIVLPLAVVSLLLCLVHFVLLPFIRVHFRSYELNSNDLFNKSVPYKLEVLSWPGYTSDQRMSKLLPLLDGMFKYADTSVNLRSRTVTSMMKVRMKWTQYQACWPLDVLSSVAALAFEVIRQGRRKKHVKLDTAPMFGMCLMFFLTTLLRASGTYFYYSTLNSVSDVLAEVNLAVKLKAQKVNATTIPYEVLLETPREYMFVHMAAIFLSLINLTFVLDYLDPV